VLYVSGEIGVGAGIIVDGELFRGSQGFGGEFGHMTVDPSGRPCACGSRGCLETLAGLEPLLEAAGFDPADAATTTGSGEPVSELATRARMGDQQALTALRESGRWLGLGIASAANLLNFQAVVLGGFFAQLATWLAGPIAHELETHVLASEWGVPRLLPSTLGPEAAVRGAAALSLRRVLTDPASAEVA
jgi:predicted NBD/HSP70 family sugar kinase